MLQDNGLKKHTFLKFKKEEVKSYKLEEAVQSSQLQMQLLTIWEIGISVLTK
jgi:hypothetical protein